MRNSLLAFAVSGLLTLSCTAKADTFNFSSSALGGSISGVLTATNNNDGSYSVTGISGTGIGGLIASNDPFLGNDNLIFPLNSRLLDVNGLAFTDTINGINYSLDLYSSVSGYLVLALDGSNNITYDSATFNISSSPAVTPEPSSFVLLATGLLGVATTAFRRRNC